MTEIWFYHLQSTALEQALPTLLEKTLRRGSRAVVMSGSTERVEALNRLLWTYRDDSFLAHGTAKDGAAADQPVWLTEQDENPNGADFLFLTDRSMSESVGDFERVIILFDDRDAGAVNDARAHWKRFRDADFTLSYWQQSRGGWTQKAAHPPSSAS